VLGRVDHELVDDDDDLRGRPRGHPHGVERELGADAQARGEVGREVAEDRVELQVVPRGAQVEVLVRVGDGADAAQGHVEDRARLLVAHPRPLEPQEGRGELEAVRGAVVDLAVERAALVELGPQLLDLTR
jgi:hypothetical protein